MYGGFRQQKVLTRQVILYFITKARLKTIFIVILKILKLDAFIYWVARYQLAHFYMLLHLMIILYLLKFSLLRE